MAGVLDHYATTRAGYDALARGDARGALEQFRRVTATGRAGAEAWLGEAEALERLGDPQNSRAAVEQALAAEPRHFRALIAKADLLTAAGEQRAASAYYSAALRNAPPPAQLDQRHRPLVARAQAACDRFARDYENHLQTALAQAGFDAAQSGSRFAHSLDLIMGRKKVFLQQPSHYYFPELPQVQFYDRALFPWLDDLEAATDDIAGEVREVIDRDADFLPYVERVADRPRPMNDSMTNNRDWAALFLWKNGEMVADNAARFPKTMKALESVPLCRIRGRTPSILFSRLRPGARIPPHHGYINTRLICHLPLIVPPGCGFRVGNDVRAWEKGKAWVFDDTIEHEAWNNSKETRVILIWEIWRPELTDAERGLVTALIEAMSTYGGAQPWTD